MENENYVEIDEMGIKKSWSHEPLSSPKFRQ
jgi:hypothetical protein